MSEGEKESHSVTYLILAGDVIVSTLVYDDGTCISRTVNSTDPAFPDCDPWGN